MIRLASYALHSHLGSVASIRATAAYNVVCLSVVRGYVFLGVRLF